MPLNLKPEVGWMVAFLTLLGVLVFVIIAFVLAFPKCPSMLFYLVAIDTTNPSDILYLSVSATAGSGTPGFGTNLIVSSIPPSGNQQSQLAQTWFFRLSGQGQQYFLFNMLVGLLVGNSSINEPAMLNAKSTQRSQLSVSSPSLTNPTQFLISTQINGATNYLVPEGNGSSNVIWQQNPSNYVWMLVPNQSEGNLSF